MIGAFHHRRAGRPLVAAPFIAVTRVALRTTPGTQDITVPGFGTPKAALFIASAAENDGSTLAQLSASIGATDGSSQWAVSFANENATSAGDTTRTVRRGAADEVIMIMSPNTGNIAMEANFTAWITDGVRITNSLTGAAYLITVILFGGDDLTAKAGTVALAAQNSSVTVTPGFQTNALLTATVDSFADSTLVDASYLRYGVASYDGSTIRQKSLIIHEAETNPTQTRGFINTSGVSCGHGATVHQELGNITSTAFNLTSRGANWTGISLGYLAFNLANGKQAWAGVVDAPTATGDKDFTDPGFQPVFGLMAPTMMPSIDVEDSTGGGFVLGLSAITAAAQYCIAVASQDNVATTNTEAVSDDAAVGLNDHAGTDAFDATFSSFISTGLRLNFTAANGTTRKWPALFVG